MRQLTTLSGKVLQYLKLHRNIDYTNWYLAFVLDAKEPSIRRITHTLADEGFIKRIKRSNTRYTRYQWGLL